MKRFLPFLTAAAALAAVALSLMPPPQRGAFHLAAFGRIPVVAEGRTKPLDTVARATLLVCSGRQQAVTAAGAEIGPEQWLLDTLFRHAIADSYPVFRIDNPEVLATLGLEARDGLGGVRFSFLQFAGNFAELERQAQMAEEVDASQRSAFQRGALELAEHVQAYVQLKFGLTGRMPRGPWTEVSDRPIDYTPLTAAWQNQDPEAFNRWVALRLAQAAQDDPLAVRKSRWEARFNAAEPFYTSMLLYVGAFLFAALSWLTWPESLRRSSIVLLAFAFVLATGGIAARMWLEGRPPVTNLYSSALFVGWAAVALCLVLERIHRSAVPAAAGSLIGFGTLIIAHHLALSGDTMEMMRAVLDSNFWLSTHVVTVTLGYAATFLAGFVAAVALLRSVLSRRPDQAADDAAARMVYGIVCFATLFSFIGTVLGGIWADQSWGRFWGWDPKENGALMIVVWNAIILHCRWGGLIRQRGLLTMAVFGNVVTAWSWFGTNMLGVGLHSYGFTASAFHGLVAFVLAQLAIMALAALPPRRPQPA
ncbi:MAG TPA: cytochrome c biogenesis protein CcsA [Opitutaceae bacterium]|jgi:ABC-type transport system involved in cytochrome c biogenesis permease subunit|nr:cytochrome c biogenesis protein CcsA [Opitutaceae bacterium]